MAVVQRIVDLRLPRRALRGYGRVGERQEGHTDNRSGTAGCPTASYREEFLDSRVRELFETGRPRDEDDALLFAPLQEVRRPIEPHGEAAFRTLRAEQQQIGDRLYRLTDANVDGLIAKDVFEERRTGLPVPQRSIEDRIAQQRGNPTAACDPVADDLERSKTLETRSETGLPAQQPELIQTSTPNRIADWKNVEIQPKNCFYRIARAKILRRFHVNLD
ncbi:MAG: hypothetical protein H6843_10835 [Rhodospirillaceae bacterium]|nr:hypothetical protein [Rhodospirillaceae bacterium]